MSFRTIRSKSFSPIFHGLSLTTCIGAIVIVLAMNAAVSSPAETIRHPSAAVSTAPESSRDHSMAVRWTDWSWGKEDGVYYIEYNRQARNKAPFVH
jgi:hypothetical protein